MNYPKADLAKRFVAALIDGIISGALTVVVPFVGWILGAAYTLTRDALMYELTRDGDWKNRSIGKKLMGLQVVTLDGKDVDMALSVKRNIILAAGSLIAAVPIIGPLASGMVGGALGLVEILLALTDAHGRRLGDKLANTQVTAVEAPHPSTAL